VLAALGVLKLATADQMHRLMAPGHKDNKAFRNAALDLARHGLAVSEGSARDGNKLWNLTPLGLDAASEVLGRPVGEMGGTARGAARSGAPHAMAVNETVIAITRTPATPTRPVPRRQTGGTADHVSRRKDSTPCAGNSSRAVSLESPTGALLSSSSSALGFRQRLRSTGGLGPGQQFGGMQRR
jgi:hypothetical protein